MLWAGEGILLLQLNNCNIWLVDEAAVLGGDDLEIRAPRELFVADVEGGLRFGR